MLDDLSSEMTLLKVHVPGKNRCVMRMSAGMELVNPLHQSTTTDIDLHIVAMKP